MDNTKIKILNAVLVEFSGHFDGAEKFILEKM